MGGMELVLLSSVVTGMVVTVAVGIEEAIFDVD
jgi:hypothetical protein